MSDDYWTPAPNRHPAAETCAILGHPGVTHNPWLARTWCLCGARTYPGRPATVDQHLTRQETTT